MKWFPVLPWALAIVGIACIIPPALQGRFNGLSLLGVALLWYALAILAARLTGGFIRAAQREDDRRARRDTTDERTRP